MILQAMAAYDKKARAFMTPFFVAHVDLGVRALAAAVNQAGAPIAAFPEDYALYHLGTFNDESAVFALLGQPLHVAEALQFKKRLELQPISFPTKEG